MKKILLTCIVYHFFFTLSSTAQVKFPAASPIQTIRQQFALGNIDLTYSRPGAKGRKVFGDLVPYNKLWRTGANAATKLTFSDAVELDGRRIDSGSYVLYTIPGEESWEVIINKGINNWGTEGYKESEDVVRFKVLPIKTKTITELFTIQFANILPEQCQLQLLWEKKLIVIAITTSVKEKLRTRIDAAMLTDKKPYWEAAQFYYEYEMNLPRALASKHRSATSWPCRM